MSPESTRFRPAWRRGASTLIVTGMMTATISACSESSSDPESYPSGNQITIVVPYEPGGPNDVSARALAPCLESELDTTVVIENRPGGGGTIGLKQVVESEPDGHTLGVTSTSTAVVAPLMADGAGYTYDDFAPLGLLSVTPSLLVVQDSSEYESAEELITAAEQDPGEITVGIPATFYDAELRRMEENHGISFSRVPFDGTSAAVAALLGGNVDAVFGAADTATMEQVDAGEFRPLATGSEKPIPYLEDTPTYVSMGYDDLTLSDSVIGLSAPKDTPQVVQDKLTETIETCSHSDEMKKTLGEEYIPDDFVGAQQVAQLFAEAQKAFEPVLA